jgi:ABC-2 type transport system ATP-binding protein
MADEIAIRVDHVSKNFRLPHERVNSIKSLFANPLSKRGMVEEQHALNDISFTIKKGEFFGIVGRNGSGKSTLLKILAGIYQPSQGKVYTSGKLVPFIELGVGFNPELTGRENVYLNGAMLGFSEKEIDAMYDDIVSFAELERFMDQKLKNYSSGMQVRLAFSMATRSEADILLIDEVLAVGDADFQRKCFEYFKTLKKNKKTVVFVSHDMAAVREYCDRAMLIDRSELQHIGNTDTIADAYDQLFMHDGAVVSSDGQRWGNGDVKITSVKAKKDAGDILVEVALRANKPVDKLIYGLHILAQDGHEVTAMNNRMVRQPDVTNLKADDTCTLTWKVQNIFNDGKYTVSITLIDDVANTLDWWVDAAGFTVRRAERSTTAVLPPVDVRRVINGKESR